MKGVFGIALLAVMSGAPPAAAQNVPSTRWVVDRTDHECLLYQSLDSAAAPNLAVRMIPGATFIELVLINPASQGSAFRIKSYDVAVEPSGARERGDGYGGIFKQRPSISISLKPSFIERLADSTSLRAAEKKGSRRFDLSFSDAEQGVRALRHCRDEVLRGWGVDSRLLEALRQLPMPPGGRTGTFFKDADYPLDAIRAAASGTVLTRLAVGVDGKVKQCSIIGSSGHKLLDDKTCVVFLRRGRFEPAIGSSGHATAATIVARTIWALPS